MIKLTVNNVVLTFEHSLISLSDWEAEHQKPFKIAEMTPPELERYFELMLIDPKHQAYLVTLLADEQKISLAKYIGSERTGTTIRQQNNPSKKTVTSELIYYWLAEFGIPFSPTETWHLSRVMMLVSVASIEKNAQAPTKPKTPQEKAQMALTMREINEKRLAELNTSG